MRVGSERAARYPCITPWDASAVVECLHNVCGNFCPWHAGLLLRDHTSYGCLSQGLGSILGCQLCSRGRQSVGLHHCSPQRGLLDDGLPLLVDRPRTLPVVVLVTAAVASADVQVGVITAAPDLRTGDASAGCLPIGTAVVVELLLHPSRVRERQPAVPGVLGEQGPIGRAQQREECEPQRRHAPSQPLPHLRFGQRGRIRVEEQGRGLLGTAVALLHARARRVGHGAPGGRPGCSDPRGRCGAKMAAEP
mmetsp:Transcript_681/g.1766  ORF Transcript_681/g.1766 Transcript_681/m.1766 type:complete len:250 (-) Transcript_681:2-751(-)